MSALYTCIECHQPVELVPPLSERESSFGVPMTKATALSIFRDGTGGRCTDCYIKHRSQESQDLMIKIGQEHERVRRLTTFSRAA